MQQLCLTYSPPMTLVNGEATEMCFVSAVMHTEDGMQVIRLALDTKSTRDDIDALCDAFGEPDVPKRVKDEIYAFMRFHCWAGTTRIIAHRVDLSCATSAPYATTDARRDRDDGTVVLEALHELFPQIRHCGQHLN